MKLAKRLEAIASFVWDQGRVIDVGSNHGYLCIYFALQKRKHAIIATDCNPKSLWEAEKNFQRFDVSDDINIVVTDGLLGIDIQDNDQIIIAGMGTKTMMHILTPEVLKQGNHFILQSNNYLYELRSYMISHGFKIAHEKVIYEHKKYYVIIDFVRGSKRYDECQLRYGPCLLKQHEFAYFTYLYEKLQKQYPRMKKTSMLEVIPLKEKIEQLKKIRDHL